MDALALPEDTESLSKPPFCAPGDRRNALTRRATEGDFRYFTDLVRLVDNAGTISVEVSALEAQQAMAALACDYLAVLDGERLVGVCSKGQVDEILGSCNGFGYAFYAKRSVKSCLLKNDLRVPIGTSVTSLLQQAFARPGKAYFDDVLLMDEAGRFLGFIPFRTLINLQNQILQQQVSELKELTAQLNHTNHALTEARDRAVEGTRIKSEFLANMSHEIRTPMNGVIGMTSLLEVTPLNAEQKELVDTIKASGEALLTVINDILDYSKIESGKLDLQPQPVELDLVLSQTLGLLASRAAEKNLDLGYAIDPAVPEVVRVDPVRLKQVLANLAGNAIKFTDEGEVFITLGLDREAGPENAKRHLRFAVRDTGIGIPQEKQRYLFQSFSQIDASTSRKYGGTGLGLAISQKLTALMGGRIWLESRADAGSIFYFTVETEAVEAALKPGREAFGGRRVLCVDQTGNVQRTFAACAARWALQARCLDDGPEAWRVFCEERWDAVVVDESAAGGAFGTLLRGHPEVFARTPKSAFLFLDTIGGVDMRGEWRALGFPNFLHKPLSLHGVRRFLAERDLPAVLSGSQTPNANPERSARPLRILLAEDHPINQKVVLRLLTKQGYHADVADNGIRVVEAVENATYDVVLMDVQMPEMDGTTATREIRERIPGERQPFIIALTANAMVGDRERFLEAGMDDYLAKPLRPDRLYELLAKVPPRTPAG